MTKKKQKRKAAAERNLSYGICRVCLCTDQEGCAEGCSWTDGTHSLCTRCQGLSEAEELSERAFAMQMLSQRLHGCVEELELLRWRLAVAVDQPIITSPS